MLNGQRHTSEVLIEGQYAALCELSTQHTDFVVHWRNQAEIQRWLPSWTPIESDSHTRWLKDCLARGDVNLACLASTGRIIGQGALYGFDPLQLTAEFGRLFFAPGCGHPFAVLEACYLIHRLGFDVLGLDRIHAASAVANRRATQLLQRLGYRQEGLLTGHMVTPWGERRDIALMALTPAVFRDAPAVRQLYRGVAPPPPGPATAPLIERLAAGRATPRSGPGFAGASS